MLNTVSSILTFNAYMFLLAKQNTFYKTIQLYLKVALVNMCVSITLLFLQHMQVIYKVLIKSLNTCKFRVCEQTITMLNTNVQVGKLLAFDLFFPIYLM